jgi:hypothetical protein
MSEPKAFYDALAEFAKEKSVMISVIGIENEEGLGISVLGTVAQKTSVGGSFSFSFFFLFLVLV